MATSRLSTRADIAVTVPAGPSVVFQFQTAVLKPLTFVKYLRRHVVEFTLQLA